MATNVRLRRSSGTNGNFNEIVHPETNIRMVEGLLGTDSKILSGLLPTFLIGSMRYVGMLNNTQTTEQLYQLIVDWMNSKGIDPTAANAEGKYFIASNSATSKITVSDGHRFFLGDDGIVVSKGDTIDLEASDWVVFNRYENDEYYWGIVNNTYADARENTKGVIQIATDVQASNSTNDTHAMTPKKTHTVINSKLTDYYKKTDVYTRPEVDGLLNTKQPLDADLTSIAALTGTNGLLRKNSANNWSLDTTVYVDNPIMESYVDVRFTQFQDNTLPNYVPITRTINSKALSSNITLNLDDVMDGATRKLSNYVPTSRTINGKALSSNISLTKSDVGLTNVADYGIANDTEAKAGSSNVKYMTPLRTKEAINQFASIELVSTLPTNMSNYPEGKLIMQIV